MKGRKKLYGDQPTVTVTLLLRRESLAALDLFAKSNHKTRSQIVDNLLTALAESYK